MKRTPSVTDRSAWPERGVAAVASGLLTSCWLVPTEAAAEGLTGWRAMVWLLVAVVWAVYLWRCRVEVADRGRTRALWWLDLAVGLVVVGHVISGAAVLFGTGQKRLAANLVVEWLALGAQWWVLRGLWNRPGWRSAFTTPLIAAAIACAVLGIWQHYVALPQMVAEYGPKLAQVRQGTASAALLRELSQGGIPLTDPGLTLFEKRLVNSTEPFGLFALANTFGGLLAAAFVWWIGGWWLSSRIHRNCVDASNPRDGMIRDRVLVVLVAAVLGWCVVLTKSRTAVVGIAAGIAWLMLGTLWSSWQASRSASAESTERFSTPSFARLSRAFIVLVLLAVVGVALVGGLVVSGVWDAEVLAEAPKSLQYRLYYWVASGRLIAEQPWLGIGPGQFRSRYLQVRLPEASEEISDPHNAWCDAWLNGGLLSVVGLIIGLIAAGFAAGRGWMSDLARTSSPTATSANSSEDANANGRRDVGIGGGGAFVALWIGDWLTGGWDDRLLAMGGVWLLVYALFVYGFRHGLDDIQRSLAIGWAASAGALAWWVHLHAAGGFEMPGAMSWWSGLLLMGAGHGTTSTDTAAPQTATASSSPAASITSWSAARCVVALLTMLSALAMWYPGAQARDLLDRAGDDLTRGRTPAALDVLASAAAVDPWNPEPWGQRAELQFRQATAPDAAPAASSTAAAWAKVWASLAEARRRDPANPRLWEQQGRYRLAEFRQTGAVDAALAAAAALETAHRLYPTDVKILQQWVAAAQATSDDDTARRAADAALRQDDLNRQLGHVERWLTDAERETLERLVER